MLIITFGLSVCEQDDHSMHNQDVHGGGLAPMPLQQDLVLGVGLK